MTTQLMLLIAASAAVLSSALTCGAQTTQPSAEAVLARYEAGLGDAKARAEVKSLRVKGRLETSPGKGMPFEERYLGEKTLLLMKYGKEMMPVQGSTGEWTWTADSAMGVMIKEGKEQGAVKRIYAIQRGLPWTSIYSKAAFSGTKKLGDEDAYVLEMTGADGRNDIWWIGAATHRLLQVDVVYPDFSGADLKMSWRYENWQATGGIFYAMKRVQDVGTMKLPYVVDSVEWSAALTDADVAPPERILSAFADPKRKTPELKRGECRIEEMKAQPILSVRVSIKPTEIAKTLGRLYGEIGQYMQRAGAEPVGQPFSRYHGMKDGMLDFEAGMAVSKAFPGEGRVKGGELPGGRIAVTIHFGPYDALPESHDKLTAWMTAEKLESGGAYWEQYLTDPGLEPDPKNWRTKLFHPVK